jgi:hypothetical protein
VIGVDGSEAAASALAVASRLAAAMGSALHLVSGVACQAPCNVLIVRTDPPK